MDIQKKLVKTKNRSLKGKIFPCLIELPVDEYGGVWTGRMYSQAPEIDGTVYITNYSREKEKIANVRMKSFKDYDLIGECVEQP